MLFNQKLCKLLQMFHTERSPEPFQLKCCSVWTYFSDSLMTGSETRPSPAVMHLLLYLKLILIRNYCDFTT